ncbi:unnamed protein product [Ambrosiozyma monospora]|uniref:Unnamed protein product n=1 Tax=Ambrosiozyma monospora TaxID=43982 RepID=A0ACB5TLY6_AMBMO|nr:unnamed protein product [Ambrosiozyma monospora]
MSQLKGFQQVEPAIQLTSIAIEEENQATGIDIPRNNLLHHDQQTTITQSHSQGITYKSRAPLDSTTTTTIELQNYIHNHDQPHSTISNDPSPTTTPTPDTETELESNTQPTSTSAHRSKNIKGWLVVLGAFFGLIPCWGIANSIGVIQTQLLQHELKSTPTTTVSWIFSINIGLTMCFTVFSGAYFDRNGARMPMLIGSLIMIGSLLALGNCTQVYQFILSFSVGVGGGASIISPALIGSVAHHFPKERRSTVMGMAGTGGCFGGVLFPAMLSKSYRTIGFAWSMRCMAFISAVCLGIACVLVKEKHGVGYERRVLSYGEKLRFYLTSSFDLKAVFKDKRTGLLKLNLFCLLL